MFDSCVADLFKMLTYCTYAGNNDFFIGLQLAEHHIILRIRSEVPLAAGLSNMIRGFETTSGVD